MSSEKNDGIETNQSIKNNDNTTVTTTHEASIISDKKQKHSNSVNLKNLKTVIVEGHEHNGSITPSMTFLSFLHSTYKI